MHGNLIRHCVFLLPLALLGCSGSATAPSSAEAWQFTLTTSAATSTTTVSCSGAGVCTQGTWTLATPASVGCTLEVSFSASFSNRAVSIADFTRTPTTTCTGPSLPRGDAAGSGSADTAYPDASSASGTVKIPFVGVFYVITGPPNFPWQARRLS